MIKNVFLLFNYTPSAHFIMALDLIQDLRQAGEEVFLLVDHASLPYKGTNPHGLKAVDYEARIRLFETLEKIDFPKKNIFFTKSKPDKFSKECNAFTPTDLTSLQAFSVDGIEIGMSVYGSLASQFRDIYFDVQENLSTIKRMISASITVYEAVLDLIDTLKPNKIYLCNGRWSDSRPTCELAQKKGIQYFLYDFGTSYKSYVTYDFFVFSIQEFHDKVKELWASGDANRESIGESWFLEQRYGKTSGSLSAMFLDRQEEGHLPLGFDTTKRNIVIYNSSVDELAGFPEWHLNLHADEIKGIEELAESAAQDPEIVLYVRIHPNLAKRNGSQLRQLQALADKNIPNLKFIWPNDSIDSYALLEAAEKIFVFHSTVGVEATFWKKPSILLGRSAYEDLDCAYIPTTKEEMTNLLHQKNLPPKGILGSLKYGFFFKKTAKPLKNFNNNLLFEPQAVAAMFKLQLSPLQKIVRGIYQRLDDRKLNALKKQNQRNQQL